MKHHAAAGVGLAALVAGLIIAVGTSSGGGGATGSVANAPSPGQSLPSGHPALDGQRASATPTPSADDTVQQRISQLESASTAHPNDVATLLRLGDAYFLGQRLARAGQTFRAVLAIDPGNPTATVRLAMVWHADGDSQRAERSLKTVLAEAPQNQEAHYSMAIVYFSSERIDDAKAEWEAAARLDPSSAIGRRSQSFIDLLDDTETPARDGSQ